MDIFKKNIEYFKWGHLRLTADEVKESKHSLRETYFQCEFFTRVFIAFPLKLIFNFRRSILLLEIAYSCGCVSYRYELLGANGMENRTKKRERDVRKIFSSPTHSERKHHQHILSRRYRVLFFAFHCLRIFLIARFSSRISTNFYQQNVVEGSILDPQHFSRLTAMNFHRNFNRRFSTIFFPSRPQREKQKQKKPRGRYFFDISQNKLEL